MLSATEYLWVQDDGVVVIRQRALVESARHFHIPIVREYLAVRHILCSDSATRKKTVSHHQCMIMRVRGNNEKLFLVS